MEYGIIWLPFVLPLYFFLLHQIHLGFFLSIHVLFVNILTEKNKTIENKIKNQQTKSVLKNMKCQIGYIDRIYR
jgi:hypothetical protein